MLSMETGAMLNQINQFIRIQIRNVGDIATGCPIDGLVNMIGVSPRYYGLLERDYGPTPIGNVRLIASNALKGWLKRLHYQRHWHAPLNRLHLHWHLQQS
jgi:hypothetical protein